MDPARLAQALHDHTTALAIAASADPEAPVPTCPDWPLRVLVGHVGQEHRWAADIIRTGPSPIPDPHDADPGPPGEWSAWLSEGAADLVDAVRSAGESPVWTFFGPGDATFWLRRMLHDTTIHHADVAGPAFTVAPDLATDAISEWLDILSDPATVTFRPTFAALRGTGQTLRLRPSEGPTWLITRTPEGVRWSYADDPADVTLSGPVRDLLLVLTRRLPVDRVTVTGNRALADHWLAHTAQ